MQKKTDDEINRFIAEKVCGALVGTTDFMPEGVAINGLCVWRDVAWMRVGCKCDNPAHEDGGDDDYVVFNPTNSLDDCAIAENILCASRGRYVRGVECEFNGLDCYGAELSRVIGIRNFSPMSDEWFCQNATIAMATPLQRCEAMLRAVGEWEEEL